jgi:hypothetical protein
MLDPTINGTICILKAVKKKASTVTQVAITSSLAAIFTPVKDTKGV